MLRRAAVRGAWSVLTDATSRRDTLCACAASPSRTRDRTGPPTEPTVYAGTCGLRLRVWVHDSCVYTAYLTNDVIHRCTARRRTLKEL